MSATKKTNEDKVSDAIDLLKEAAVNFVKENPNSNTSNVCDALFPRWFDEKGYVMMKLLVRLEEEGVLQSTGGGKGSPRIWDVVEPVDEKVKQFIKVATDGDIAKLKRLIAEGADINAKGAVGASALAWAVFYGRVEVIEVLIDAGADVNVPQNDGNTALMIAAHGQVEMVKMLIGAGANVNMADNNYGETALMAAVKEMQIEVVRILLDAGADVNVKNNEGKTALDLTETPEITRLLKAYPQK